MLCNQFGWQNETKTAEIEALKALFDDEKQDLSACVETLYSLLLSEVSQSSFPKACRLSVEKGSLSLYQEADKEYCHDGSVQPKKSLELTLVSKEDFLAASAKKETPSFPSQKNWLPHLKHYFFYKDFIRYCSTFIYAEDFLGLGCVLLTVTDWE